jgi:ABC-type Fe3+-hydroxamate transport system substrate-binding protein
MRVLVCGGRDFDDTELMINSMLFLHEKTPFSCIIEGGARGADRGARTFAIYMNIPFETYFADWDKYGKGAGPIRNKQMIVEGKPDMVIAFPGGHGTANMIKQATNAGIKIIEIKENTSVNDSKKPKPTNRI